jgi:TatD DNase family protein
VTDVIAVGENLCDARRNVAIAVRHEGVHVAAGLYPTRLGAEEAAEMMRWIRDHRDRLVAIGEVGLDRWTVKDERQRELQASIFAGFVDLSLELDLPLNVHSRSAGRHAISLLLDRGAKRVQMHAFDGRAGTALPAVEAGWMFSIPPSVVRSRQKQKLVRALPLESLLLETDSPVLGPEPDARNEPANLTNALRAVAEIKELPIETVAWTTSENARRLYRLGAGREIGEPSR